MQLSMQVAYAAQPRESARQVAELEKAGLDIAWVAEAYTFDGPTYMGYLAALTETVKIGAGILPIYTRTPTLLAMTAAGADALSGGRCIMGLGASGPQVIEGFHGITYDYPLGRTREIIEVCRQVWRREGPLVHDGARYQIPLPAGKGTGLGRPLKIINRPVRPSIPIYVAALGEKNVELTAEVADGWLPMFFVPEKAKDVFGSSLAAGAARRPADLAPLEICAGGLLAIGEESEVAPIRELGRAGAALYIGGMGAKGRNFYNALVRRYGYEAEAETIQELYLSGEKKQAEAAVPAELLELTNLVGPESYLQDRLAVYKQAGVTVLNVTPVSPDPVRAVATVKSWLV
ncbi:MAG TPA: LLM class F420-dependent oxidoreductase [Acidimicrobiales bacterium]|nr:LLM class F420-dependent oxidoreductase [Acidimicrobiales bacterium]